MRETRKRGDSFSAGKRAETRDKAKKGVAPLSNVEKRNCKIAMEASLIRERALLHRHRGIGFRLLLLPSP